MKKGFTLIELMVVIAIIGILAAIAIGIVGSAKRKACRMKTLSALKMLNSACEAYKGIFQDYPNLNDLTPLNPPTYPPLPGDAAYAGTKTYSAASMVVFNKRLRYMLEEVRYQESGPAWAAKTHDPLIQQGVPKMEDTDGVEMYLDGYGNPFNVWWGRDHRTDTPNGPQNYRATTPRYRLPLDIYSNGSDFIDDVSDVGNGAGTDTTTNVNLENIDDMVSWQTQMK